MKGVDRQIWQVILVENIFIFKKYIHHVEVLYKFNRDNMGVFIFYVLPCGLVCKRIKETIRIQPT